MLLGSARLASYSFPIRGAARGWVRRRRRSRCLRILGFFFLLFRGKRLWLGIAGGKSIPILRIRSLTCSRLTAGFGVVSGRPSGTWALSLCSIITETVHTLVKI